MNSNKKLLLFLLALVIGFSVYNWGYRPLENKKDNLEQEVMSLENEYEVLETKKENESKLKEEIEEFKSKIKEIEKDFAPSLTQEQAIVVIDDMEEKIGVEYNSVSFSEIEEITKNNNDLKGIKQTLSLGYKVNDYNVVKEILKYVKDYEYKMVIDTLDLNVKVIGDQEEDKRNVPDVGNASPAVIEGNIVISFYGLQSPEREIPELIIPDIPIGDKEYLLPNYLIDEIQIN